MAYSNVGTISQISGGEAIPGGGQHID